jgi:hypothetical protein
MSCFVNGELVVEFPALLHVMTSIRSDTAWMEGRWMGLSAQHRCNMDQTSTFIWG